MADEAFWAFMAGWGIAMLTFSMMRFVMEHSKGGKSDG